MGESMVEETVIEGKMGETAARVGNLEVSVSFGRFENDLLSWDRWSSFSQNKYLEEVEKCSTPGSVAEKKAYFEAHYQKVAAKKAEMEYQQKQIESSLLMATKNNESTITKNEEIDKEHKQLEADSLGDEKPIGEGPVAEKSEIMNKGKQLQLDLIPENNNGAYPIQSKQSDTADFHLSDDIQSVEEVNNYKNKPGRANVVGKANDGDTDEVFQTTVTVGEKQESYFRSDTGDAFVGELEHVARVEDSPRLVEAPTEAHLNTGEVLKSSTREMTELKTQKMTKVLLTNSERNVTKKAPLEVTLKSPHTSCSTSKTAIPISTPIMMSPCRSSAMKGRISSESRIKNSYAENKKLAPRTATMSLSPGLARYASVTATRKSTLMEKMSDKDIVKRASKSFQPNPDPMTSPGKQSDSLPKQVLKYAKETTVNETITSQKGKKWLHKTGVLSANVAQSAPLLANSRIDPLTHKGKEMKYFVSRNSNVNIAAGSHILAKSKEVKEAAARDLQRSRGFKATLLPAFYRGNGVSKSLVRKESPKSQSLTDRH